MRKKTDKRVVDPMLETFNPKNPKELRVFSRTKAGVSWLKVDRMKPIRRMTEEQFSHVRPGAKGVLFLMPSSGNLFKSLELDPQTPFEFLQQSFRCGLLYTSKQFFNQ